MPALAFDLDNLSLIAQELGAVGRDLARSRAEVPAAVRGFLGDLTDQVGSMSAGDLQWVDSAAWSELQRAAFQTYRALHEDDDERLLRRRLRLLVEELSMRFDRLSEAAALMDERPVGELLKWMDDAWRVPQERKADLLQTSKRTYQRWLSLETDPGPEDEQRVRLVARLYMQLRTLLTGKGFADWLASEHPAFDGRAPMQVIAHDPTAEDVQKLDRLAWSLRSGAAA